MKNTVDKNAEALEVISHEFHDLVTSSEPEYLHNIAWDMFQSYLLAKSNDVLPVDIYTYTLIYEFFRNTCKQLENIPPVYGNRFKITYCLFRRKFTTVPLQSLPPIPLQSLPGV